MQAPTMAISTAFSLVSYYLGIGWLIAVAMLVAVVVETVTGIYASHIKGEDFESFKFSRCILKVFIWLSLVFIVNCFALECGSKTDWLNKVGEVFFDIVKLLILIYFVCEYLVSIMENFAVIDGKPKTAFIDAVKSLWAVALEKLKGKV